MTEGYGSEAYGQQPRIVGYDAYGQPVYQHDVPQQGDPGAAATYGQAGAYDPYGAQSSGHGGYDAYGTDPGLSQHGQQPQQTRPWYEYPHGGQQGVPYQTQQHPQQAQPQEVYTSPPTDSGHGYAPQVSHGTHDTYGTHDPYDPYASYDPYGPAADSGPQQPVPGDYGYDPYGPAADTSGWVPRQAPPPATEGRDAQVQATEELTDSEPWSQTHAGTGEGPYDTEQFSFVEEETESSEDVIDWLKFSESRTERREEAKRRGRNRKTALIVLLVLVMVAGTGYLWYAGKIPGLEGESAQETAAGGQQRDVTVVHLRDTDGESNSTALLVDNDTAEHGTTLLLPNSLAVSTGDGGTTTLGKSVESEGATPTRESLDRLFGADIKGTWRLDTPFLEILVDSVGGVPVTPNTTVPGEKKSDDPLVERGKKQTLNGRAAVAYATHRGSGEAKTKQLARFGQVMQATLGKVPNDKSAATKTVQNLGQILDPSLSESSLGATLAGLSQRVREDAYDTRSLPVRENGTLSDKTSQGVVKDVLGGTVRNTDPEAAPTVSVRNAAGAKGAYDSARVTLVNGGFTVVGGESAGSTQRSSEVSYAKAAHKAKAEEVAKTLGLSADAVTKGKTAGNADVAVVLGKDYEE